MEGEVAEVVQADDKLFYLEKDGTDDHALTVKEEITLTNELVLYTDGITDANNNRNEMYGEDRLLKFFNEFK